MIQVGVFWIFLSLDIDIIYDIEEYPNNYQSKEDLLTYSKQHKDVWAKLAKEQCNGKYSLYKYDTLPRGRVSYNIEDKSYNIVFYRNSKELIEVVLPKLKKLFALSDEIINISRVWYAITNESLRRNDDFNSILSKKN